MNLNEAKTVLLLYRPGTADAEDPQVAEALALAKQSPELARWLAEHTARQASLRGQFRRIPVPAGLKEQILAETVGPDRIIPWSWSWSQFCQIFKSQQSTVNSQRQSAL